MRQKVISIGEPHNAGADPGGAVSPIPGDFRPPWVSRPALRRRGPALVARVTVAAGEVSTVAPGPFLAAVRGGEPGSDALDQFLHLSRRRRERVPNALDERRRSGG